MSSLKQQFLPDSSSTPSSPPDTRMGTGEGSSLQLGFTPVLPETAHVDTASVDGMVINGTRDSIVVRRTRLMHEGDIYIIGLVPQGGDHHKMTDTTVLARFTSQAAFATFLDVLINQRII